MSDKVIDDFSKALKEALIRNFGSLEKATQYGDMLEAKNKTREAEFLERMKKRKENLS